MLVSHLKLLKIVVVCIIRNNLEHEHLKVFVKTL